MRADQGQAHAVVTYTGQVLALAAVYVVAGKLGLMMAPVSGFASLVWPPAGVSLAALVVGGYRLFPGIVIGAFATNLWAGAPPLVASGIAVGNTLAAIAGTFGLRSIPGFRGSLDRFKDVVYLAVIAGVSSVISATVGVASLTVGGIISAAGFAQAWRAWWAGDLLSALIVASVLLAWIHGPPVVARPAVLAKVAVLGAILSACAVLVFIQQPAALAKIPILQPDVLFLPLIWVALCYGVRGAATGTAVVAVIAVWGTYSGHGVFVRAGRIESFIALSVFLTSISLASLILGSVVSERKAETQARTWLAAIVESSADAVIGQTLDGMITSWNAAAEQMYGYGRDEAIGQPISMLVPPERRDELACFFDRTRRCERIVHHETVRCRKDGTTLDVSLTLSPICDASGTLIGVSTIERDITERKQAEQERATLLERERLARAEAQTATRTKDEFLAVLSHELRTPLQSMLGWTQMLKERGLDERTVQKGLLTIERNVKMQTQLIEDLLDVSRIVAGKLRLARTQVDLAQVIASGVDLAKVAADAKSIRIDMRIEPMAGEILGDPTRLQQVVSNLLTNAVKFTPREGSIRVRLERDDTVARITVEDTGRGISPEFLPHIFDRFCQAESVTLRSQGGLGLGLAIVRHLVELHGGAVKAESPGNGRGATFTVTLPIVSSERRVVAAERQETTRNAPLPPIALEGVRILLVDDDPDAGDMLEAVLQRAGADVRAHRSAHGALEEIESFHPHLLISDIGMPEKDGYALLRQVRARESVEGGHVLAVALTAFASQADREQALAVGFEAHIAKPVSPYDIVNTVARLVERAA
jgi:PAS domain S-box-containing protein